VLAPEDDGARRVRFVQTGFASVAPPIDTVRGSADAYEVVVDALDAAVAALDAAAAAGPSPEERAAAGALVGALRALGEGCAPTLRRERLLASATQSDGAFL
jgi:hypothetical protein